MKGYHKSDNRVKLFFAVLNQVLNETTFYVKLAGWFSGSKAKVMWFFASKFGTSMQLINIKFIAVKIYASSSNRSRAIS